LPNPLFLTKKLLTGRNSGAILAQFVLLGEKEKVIFPLSSLPIVKNGINNHKVVVDSSVIIKWLNSWEEERLEQANSLLKDCEQGKVELFSPELSKYEIGNALLKGKKLSLAEARAALTLFYQLPITFKPENDTSAHETYQLAESYNITYYDASFVALARQLSAVLVTDNPKHQAKVTTAHVIPLSAY
jgi:predicted nucleic acid-binding protein